MSKLSEYLKLIPKGINNVPQIFSGVMNQARIEFGTISKEKLDIIVGRRMICKTCPFMSENAVKSGIYKTDRNDEHCMYCSCPTSTRTASLESNCGIEVYNYENPESPMDLKWTAVNGNNKQS